jgi:hypothetical protein
VGAAPPSAPGAPAGQAQAQASPAATPVTDGGRSQPPLCRHIPAQPQAETPGESGCGHRFAAVWWLQHPRSKRRSHRLCISKPRSAGDALELDA